MEYTLQVKKGKPQTMQDNITDIVRKQDYPHYVMTLFAPHDKRAALFALYALNVELGRIRSLVTEPMMGLIRIQWWRETITKLYNGEVLRQYVVAALHEIIKHNPPWPEKEFQNLIDAWENDLRLQSFSSEQEYLNHSEEMGQALLGMVCRLYGSAIADPLIKIIGKSEYVTMNLETDPRCANLNKKSIMNDVLQKIILVDRRIIRGTPAFLSYNFTKWKLKYLIRHKLPNEMMLGFYLWRKSIGF